MTLSLYLSRVVATRILAVLASLTSLVMLIELLEAIRRMLGGTRGVGTVITYLALRFPLAIDRLLPLAVLIGCALAFATLARSNEMAILRSAGLSPARFLKALWPVMLVCGTLYYLLEDHWAPSAEKAFALWWQDVVSQSEDDDATKDPTQWVRVGGQIVSIGTVEDDGRTLRTVTRYSRDEAGLLTVVARAQSATFDGTAWHLDGETQGHSDGSKALPEKIWANGPAVENMRQLTLPLSRMSSAQAEQVLGGRWSGKDTAAHYHIVVQRSYAAATIPLIMLLLAIPALHGQRRAGNMAFGMASSLGLGLTFMVVNGLFLSMGEAAAIPATLAVWAAPVSFILLGVTAWLHFEEGRR